MAAPTSKKSSLSLRRRQLYGKIEIAKKDLGLDEDTYRDMLEEKFGVRSRTDLRDGQLVQLVEDFKSLGWRPKPSKRRQRRDHGRPLADDPQAKKARALWLSLYWLGIVRDKREAALAGYVKRMAGVDALQFVTNWEPIIEGLKAWATREGGPTWEGYPVAPRGRYYNDRAEVAEAQWALLFKLGEISISNPAALANYAMTVCRVSRHQAITDFTDDQLDLVIQTLGRKVRKAKGMQV